MKCQLSQSLLLLLLVSLACLAQARRTPAGLARSNDAGLEPLADQDKHRAVSSSSAAAAAAAAAGAGGNVAGNTGIKDASSGRLFLKKFLKFKNMFSSNNQPVIPIIITNGAATSTTGTSSPTSPTVTVTSTGTIPSATGTITTSPTTPTTPTTTARGYNVMQADDVEQPEDDDDDEAAAGEGHEHEELEHVEPAAVAMAANAELLDEQALQSALAAGAQEYEVFTQPEQADESKATQNNRINLRRKGGRRGQKGEVISVRVPPRYRRYFKNGQKVMLNTKSRPAKRRVVRKRIQGGGNKNQKKKNGNKNKNKRFNNRRRRGGNKNKNRKNKNKRTRIPVV